MLSFNEYKYRIYNKLCTKYKRYTFTCYLVTEAFAATGWRVGWLIGPEWIMTPTLAATTRIVFCSNSPLQEAAAAGLEQAKERKFFETQLQEYEERRNVLIAAFDRLGLKYTLPQGSYFVLLVSPRFFSTTILPLRHLLA